MAYTSSLVFVDLAAGPASKSIAIIEPCGVLTLGRI